MKTSIIKKITFAVLFTFPLFLSALIAQNDTMYIMKNGVIVGKYNVITEIDSVIFYQPTIQDTTIEDTTRGTFTDGRDSTVYNWVTIGNQVWMSENLKYLIRVSDPIWEPEAMRYYVYNYFGTDVNEAKETSNYATYGVLYSYYAANGLDPFGSSTNPSGLQGICPFGWHLPSDAEWTELTDYLGGESVAGGKLKETGTIHWNSPNTGATNETGFTALPGGCRDSMGGFSDIGYGGYWWSATIEFVTADYGLSWARSIGYGAGSVFRNSDNMYMAYSVRCIRD